MDTLPGSRIDPFAWEARVAGGLEPRLLADLPSGRSHAPLSRHRLSHARPPRPDQTGGERIIAEIARSGLTGRGGAGFPTARKWRAVASGRRPVIVVNGAEGEPAAGKDALMMSRRPHLVIDGALWAAAAVGADRVFLCVGSHAPQAVAAVESALAELRGSERRGVRVEVREVPDRYVAGESSALVQMLDGQEAVPTATPPRTSERGYQRRATLVQNAETLAHAALIMNRGAAWYRSAGTSHEPGTRLVSVSGAVAAPVVCEVEAGTPLREIFGSLDIDRRDVGGVLAGGWYGTWLTPDAAFDSDLSSASLSRHGASPGCGVLHVLPADECGLAAVSQIASWFAGESAGQCGPCVLGLEAISVALEDVVAGAHDAEAKLMRVRRWTEQLPGRGGCSLPDGAAAMLRSGMSVFANEVRAHRSGFCAAAIPVGASA